MIVLLPALELGECLIETVRRQVSRGLGRTSADRAGAKICERSAGYLAVPAPKVGSAGPLDSVVAGSTVLLPP